VSAVNINCNLVSDRHSCPVNQIWVPIAIALFGNAVAILVVILTNRQTIKRDEARQDRQDARLERLRRDGRVQRAVDNRWRIIELQRDYYVDFHKELRAASLAIHDAGYEIGPKLEFGWNLSVYESLIRLQVFASEATFEAASEANTRLWRWGESGEGGYESDLEIAYDKAFDQFLIAVRHDLGIEIDEDRLSADDIIN
jgi:hypothetical protein